MLFVPIGYLLPYVFRWFRARVRIRPVVCCLLLSLLVENLQLVTRRGMYDFDDIISNTLGGWIGQLLYIAVGYVVTHPDWRKDLREYRRWKHRARSSTLFPYTRKSGMFRTTLMGSDQAAVCDFYVNRLGFRLLQQLDRRESGDVVFLFEMGKTQIQVVCSLVEPVPARQHLTLYAVRLAAVRKRLESNGIAPGDYRRDPCTGRRMLRFTGPDNVRIEIMEAD
jgi:catechol 2,3-dioxygenase-like lactoylglutathione lyase family enzyme